MTIFQAFKAANIQTDNHESDLYVEVTAESTAILLKFPIHFKNATRFRSQIDGKLNYDIPFAYEPFWTEKLGISR
jgi:hypothetical protein